MDLGFMIPIIVFSMLVISTTWFVYTEIKIRTANKERRKREYELGHQMWLVKMGLIETCSIIYGEEIAGFFKDWVDNIDIDDMIIYLRDGIC